MKMKTRTKVVTSIIAFILTCVMFITVAAINPNTNQVVGASVRTVQLTQTAVDSQSILDEFDNAKLTTKGTTTYFEGYKPLDTDKLSEIDYISEDDFEELENCAIKYNFSYDVESNVVTVAASTTLPDGSIEIDEIRGVGFINDDGEIDAVMNVDGEGILLSEMRSAGMIENCGWFSRWIKKVVKVVTIAVVATAVIVASAAVAVATAGVAAPALIAAGVGTVAAYGAGAAAGLAAGAIFYSTLGSSAMQAGVELGEQLGTKAEDAINSAEDAIRSLTNKVKAKISELSKLIQYKGQHFIVRAGNFTNLNFTPKDKDYVSTSSYGLSFFKDVSALFIALPSTTKVCITTVELVNMTGVLYVQNDYGDHMSVKTSLGVTAFKNWINSRSNAESSPHEYTVQLKSKIIAVI